MVSSSRNIWTVYNPQFLSWRSNIDKLLIFQMRPVEHQEGMFISFNLQQLVNSGSRGAFQCPETFFRLTLYDSMKSIKRLRAACSHQTLIL